MRLKTYELIIVNLLLFIFSTASLQAETDANESSVKKQAHFLPLKLLDTRNPFIKAIKYRQEFDSVKKELKTLNKKLKYNIKMGNASIVNDLEEQKEVLDSKHEILMQKSQKIYERITKITSNAGNENYNLLNYISKKPLEDVQKAIQKLLTLQDKYKASVDEIQSTQKKLQLSIEQSTQANEKKALKLQLGAILQAKRYLQRFDDLFDKQYDQLLEQRNSAETRYNEYHENEIIQHITTLIVLAFILIILIILRQLNNFFVKVDERQIFYRKLLSTSAILISFSYLLFSYSENIIYSLTIFTFVGAAIFFATRSFLLNIIAWMNIIISKFIKVGDRILIPHETKYYHGDVIAISPVQITLYETYDFSSTRQAVNAGRIIFIPNNYTLSHGVINYTHVGQKYIYDSLSFNLSFESDLQRCKLVTAEVVTRYNNEHAQEAQSQFRQLKKRYPIKQRMLEPEIQFNVNSSSTGIAMTVWFLTPTQQKNEVKNTILFALLERYAQEDSIEITKKAKSGAEAEASSES